MIYLDNNATTQVTEEVVAAMMPFLRDHFANPSSPYRAGLRVARAVGEARDAVASLVGVDPGRVVFTSGGTEANNASIEMALAARPSRRRIVVSAVEHVSVLAAARAWRDRGYEVLEIPVDHAGGLDRARFEEALDERTALVSIMAANNETGVLFPVAELVAEARACGALVHSDVVQAVGKVTLDAGELGVDFFPMAAHKFHGPKGIGALVFGTEMQVDAVMKGGGQELGRRAGTENVAGIVGMGAAASLASNGPEVMASHVAPLRDRLESGLLDAVPGVEVMGRSSPRLPNTLCARFTGVDSAALIALLDEDGICCSSGSACAAGSHEPSHVVSAMGVEGPALDQMIRISLNRFSTEEEVDALLAVLPGRVAGLRATGTVFD